ncbi:MAG: hypothetical protein SVS15_07820, partial [Thermodesulfobacteriota bacterium]|nr:hypothetical protein [Thermodesulfobacteriota bacterium]
IKYDIKSSNDKGERPPRTESQETIGTQELVENLRKVAANRRNSERLLLCLLFFVLFLGIIAFRAFFGESILSDVQEAAMTINNSKIKRVIDDSPYDERMYEIKIITKNIIKTITTEMPKTEKKGVLIKLKNDLEGIIKKTTAISSESEKSYGRELKQLGINAEKLEEAMKKLPPVDWERIFIRATIVVVIIFLMQIIFSAYKYASTERSRITDQITGISLITESDEDNKLNALGVLIDKMSSRGTIFEKTPPSAVKSLADVVSKVVETKKI